MSRLVSIIIPCYNHEKYLDSCLQSIVGQTYSNIELLICDDCSLDNSYKKLLDWKPLLENRFSRVEIYSNGVNQGVCKTLNGLVSKAQGAYIKTLASDDMLRPTAIADYVEFASETEFDVLFGNAYIIGENEQYPITEHPERKKAYSKVPLHGRYLTQELIKKDFVQGATLFIRKETFEKYGLFDEQNLYEDWEFLLRVSVTGTIEYLDKLLAYYRVVDGSLSHYDTYSKEGQRKFRIAYRNNRETFLRYSQYASKETEMAFFSQNIRTAIVMKDHVLVDDILEEMKNRGLILDWSNRIRIVSFKLGVYHFLRDLKNTVNRSK